MTYCVYDNNDKKKKIQITIRIITITHTYYNNDYNYDIYYNNKYNNDNNNDYYDTAAITILQLQLLRRSK